jgi:hypothetical protein
MNNLNIFYDFMTHSISNGLWTDLYLDLFEFEINYNYNYNYCLIVEFFSACMESKLMVIKECLLHFANLFFTSAYSTGP